MNDAVTIDLVSQLKPCPFCGSPARVLKVQAALTGGEKIDVTGLGCSDPDCILFADIDSRVVRLMFRATTEEAVRTLIRGWNRRPE